MREQQKTDHTEQRLGMVGQPYGWIGKHSGEFIKNVGQGHVEGTPLYASEQAEQQAEGAAFKEKNA